MIFLFKEVISYYEAVNSLPSVKQEKKLQGYLSTKEMNRLKKVPYEVDPSTRDKFARAFWYPPYKGAYVEISGSKIFLIPDIVLDRMGYSEHKDDYQRLVSMADLNNWSKHAINYF